MSTTLTLDQREPLAVRAAVVAVATAVVHIGVVVGLLDTDTETAIGGLIDAVGLVVLLFVARPSVTANAKVITRVTTAGQVVAGDAAVTEVGTVLPLVGAYPPTVDAIKVKPELLTAP